jgi:hypothetical protein
MFWRSTPLFRFALIRHGGRFRGFSYYDFCEFVPLVVYGLQFVGFEVSVLKSIDLIQEVSNKTKTAEILRRD